MEVLFIIIFIIVFNIIIACGAIGILAESCHFNYNLKKWFYILLITGIFGALYLWIKEVFGLINELD